MMHMKRLVSALILSALMLVITAGGAMADALYGVITTPSRDGSVNLRAKAGVTQSIVGWGKNGDEVEILYRGNTWHRVRLIKNGRVGWVYGRYLKIGSTSASTTTGAQVSGTVGQIMTKYPSSTVNLRSGPSSDYSVLGEYGRGTRLEILDSSANWYKVQIAGSSREGWMSKNYISLGLSARTTGRVNLRRGSGTGYAVIKTLPNGQSLTVTWVGDTWSKVQADGYTGYISNKYYSFR